MRAINQVAPNALTPKMAHKNAQAQGPKILGVDCGLNYCGWALVELEGGKTTAIADRFATSPRDDICSRLALLDSKLDEIIKLHRPNMCAFEETYVNKNPRSSLTLAMARGALLSAVGRNGIEAAGYSPSTIKKVFLGSGRANKAQMQGMASRFVDDSKQAKLSEDAADAIAVAFTHLTVLGLAHSAWRAR